MSVYVDTNRPSSRWQRVERVRTSTTRMSHVAMDTVFFGESLFLDAVARGGSL